MSSSAARSPSTVPWSPWQTLHPGLTLEPRVLAEVVDGGQSFRWWRQTDGSWLGQWSRHVVALRLDEAHHVQWRTAADDPAVVGPQLARYLVSGDAQAQAVAQLPWRSDPHLARALAAFPGLRLLRQPFAETLLGFLCSATKQIVQIKQCLALLSARVGPPTHDAASRTAWAELAPGAALGYALPTWAQLAETEERTLRACLLGFRARYIRATADHLAAAPGWLERVEAAPYAEAREMLCQLPGVGEKVADCVLLFGAGRDESFPVDVWILKAMARRYGLDGWSPAHVAHFGRVHFGAHAGLAQQYLFAFERAESRASPT